MKVSSKDLNGISIPVELEVKGLKIPAQCTTVHLGKFTHSKIKCEIDGKRYVSEGLSRRSYKDRPDDKRAYTISTGRAVKAIMLKIEGKTINSLLMA